MPGGTISDTQFALYDGCNGNLIAANDDDGFFGHAKLTLTCDMLVPGHEYILLIDGFNGQTGSCDLSMTTSEDLSGNCGMQ